MGAADPGRHRAGQHDRRVICENAADRKAETWASQLAPFERLEFAVSDAAKGIAKAVADIAGARRDDPGAPALEHGLDVFHTAMEASRVLARSWAAGRGVLGEGRGRRVPGRRVETARDRRAGAWPGPPAALGSGHRVVGAGRASGIGLGPLPGRPWEVFRPDGHLNDRTHARARSPRRSWT